MNESQKSKYVVHFRGYGYTAPTADNPNGLRVMGTGQLIVTGPRPTRTFDTPSEVLTRCKQAFMEQCHCVSYAGDSATVECFPVIRLGRAV